MRSFNYFTIKPRPHYVDRHCRTTLSIDTLDIDDVHINQLVWTFQLCCLCRLIVFLLNMSDEDIVLAAAGVIIAEVASLSQQKRRPRRYWIRPSLVHGRKKYSTTEFMKDLLLDDVDELNLEYRCNAGFRNFFRMGSCEFEQLSRMIAPIIFKRDTRFRQAVPVRERFAVALRFLATGDSYTSLSYMFKISKQTISNIVPEVCDALITVLKDAVKVRNTIN